MTRYRLLLPFVLLAGALAACLPLCGPHRSESYLADVAFWFIIIGLSAALAAGLLGVAWALWAESPADDPSRHKAAEVFGVHPDDLAINGQGEWVPRPDARPQAGLPIANRRTRVYVASSWRNRWQPDVVHALTTLGFHVYDFRNPPGRAGFAWGAIDPAWQAWTVEQFTAHLGHPDAIAGYAADMAGLSRADVCVLVLPCGRSAHLEAGWAAGRGIPLIIYSPEPCEPELMYRMATTVCSSPAGLVDALLAIESRRNPMSCHWGCPRGGA